MGTDDRVDEPSVPPVPSEPPVHLPKPLRTAAVIVGLEALALAGLGVWLLIDSAFLHGSHVLRGLLSAAFVLAGAAALGFGCRGLLHASPAARTPVVVLQVLAIPVGYDIVEAGNVGYGAPMLIAVVAVLYLLFTPPVRAVLDRELDR